MTTLIAKLEKAEKKAVEELEVYFSRQCIQMEKSREISRTGHLLIELYHAVGKHCNACNSMGDCVQCPLKAPMEALEQQVADE